MKETGSHRRPHEFSGKRSYFHAFLRVQEANNKNGGGGDRSPAWKESPSCTKFIGGWGRRSSYLVIQLNETR